MTPRHDLDRIAEHMKAAARIGGAALARHFADLRSVEIMEKGPSDFVSAADLDSERQIIASLAETVPDIPVLGEEGGGPEALTAPACIVVDPLDGTNNFVHGIPHFSVSMAMVVAGEVVIGVTFNPINGDLFWAVKGRGAWLGDRRLAGSPRDTLPRAVLGTCFPYHGKGNVQLCAREMAAIMPHVSGIRSPGSAALELAYVAEGRFDAFWSHGARLDLWDIAAGVVIIREAGCLVTEVDGAGDPLQCRSILAAPPAYHGRIAALLASGG